MAFLTLNGITVPVASGEGSGALAEIGERSRAFDGSMRISRRATKRGWAFTSVPVTSAEGVALMGLIQGDGHHWSFDSNVYSSKGLAPTTATLITWFGSGGWAGGRIEVSSASAVLSYTHGHSLRHGYTVLVRRQESGTWKHYAVLGDGSDSGTPNRAVYTDGVLTGSATWLTVTDSLLTIVGESATTFAYDEVTFLPFRVPVEWVAQFAANTLPLGLTPVLAAGGDGIAGTGGANVVGLVGGFDLLPGSSNLHTVSFELVEK